MSDWVLIVFAGWVVPVGVLRLGGLSGLGLVSVAACAGLGGPEARSVWGMKAWRALAGIVHAVLGVKEGSMARSMRALHPNPALRAGSAERFILREQEVVKSAVVQLVQIVEQKAEHVGQQEAFRGREKGRRKRV